MNKNTRFDKRIKEIPAYIWGKIVKIEELKGRWSAGVNLSPQILNRLKKSVLVTSTGASTRIEGARLNDEDVEKLLRGLDIQKFTDRDKQEVRGYFELLENVFNSWSSIKFSENTIKHFHKELLKYTEKDNLHRGDYKKKENKVVMVDKTGPIAVLFDTTPAYLTPKEMQELMEWTQSALLEKKSHPLIIIGNFLVEFLKIHPFEDGNGRLSRVLTNFLLLKEGYLYAPYVSHEKLIEDNKPDYYAALRESQKTLKTHVENIVPWLDFFLSVLLAQAESALNLLSGESIEDLLSAKQTSVWQYLQTVNEAGPNEIARKTKVARTTVGQALRKLLRLNQVKRIGLGRSVRYKKALNVS